MKKAKPAGRVLELVAAHKVTDGKGFRLDAFDPGETGGFDREEAERELVLGIGRLSALQEKIYAQDRWALLAVFQAMDAAGKDSTIKHVMSGVNPQGCDVHSFKAPSREEIDHDYLWRCAKVMPERGKIGIFNRSYYEEVLVVRVHPALLEAEMLPPKRVTRDLWNERFDSIRDFERHMARNGTVILKFFLHLSKKEQKKRLIERLENPEKNWKYSAQDVRERGYWKDYMKAYERVIQETAKPHAPWYVVPADHKWFTQIVVAAAMVDALDALDLEFPRLAKAERRAIDRERRKLMER